jgi:5'-nucleotidase-like protein
MHLDGPRRGQIAGHCGRIHSSFVPSQFARSGPAGRTVPGNYPVRKDWLLEQQWLDPKRPRILQVSNGFSYTWDASKPFGERVITEKMMLNGRPLEPGRELPRHPQRLPRRRRRRFHGGQARHLAAIWRL